MSYVQGFVIPVPTGNKDAYRRMAEKGWEYFKKHGALRQVECWGDDVPDGTITSFPLAVKRKDGETVVFSWIEWPSKEFCLNGAKAAMDEFSADPEFSVDRIPFDGMRMFWGGFEPIFDKKS